MRIVVIETGTERGCVALIEDGQLIHEVLLPVGLKNSNHLLPAIDQLLETVQLKVAQLDCIVAGIGPGSYTGLRIGAMVAKTLAWSHQIPLVGACSLQGYLPDAMGSYAVMIDAKAAGVYLLTGTRGSRGGECTLPEMVPLKELSSKLEGISQLVCPHVEALSKKWEPLPSQSWQEKGPDPLQLAKIGLEAFERGEFSSDGSLELNYMREPLISLHP